MTNLTNSTNLINEIKNVCVYSSSSNKLDEIYYQVAREMGILIGKSGFNLVYGGGSLGTMFKNAQAVKEFGGMVYGVLPKKLHELGVGNNFCDILHVTEEMRSRKEKLDKLSDAIIALSGGFGTLEELAEMIVQKQLGYNKKAIVILNTNGFYDHLLNFFDVIISQNFATDDAAEIYFVAKTPDEAIEYLINYQPSEYDITEKWLKKEELRS